MFAVYLLCVLRATFVHARTRQWAVRTYESSLSMSVYRLKTTSAVLWQCGWSGTNTPPDEGGQNYLHLASWRSANSTHSGKCRFNTFKQCVHRATYAESYAHCVNWDTNCFKTSDANLFRDSFNLMAQQRIRSSGLTELLLAFNPTASRRHVPRRFQIHCVLLTKQYPVCIRPIVDSLPDLTHSFPNSFASFPNST